MASRLVVLLLLGGCATTEPLVVEHRSVLAYDTRGMALAGDGGTGHAGMFDTTCDFRTRTARVGTDYDFEGATDTVTDGADEPGLGFTTLVLTGSAVHVVRPDRGTSVDLRVEGATHAALVGDAVVVLVPVEEGCEARWMGIDDGAALATAELPQSACDPASELRSDHAGRAFVATGDDVLVLDEEGATALGEPADLVAFDPADGALLLADRGGASVRSVGLDGDPGWETVLDGELRALDALGARGGATVAVARGTEGALLLLDEVTGAPRVDLPTPAPADDLVVSGDGSVLGLVLPEETHFYEVVAE